MESEESPPSEVPSDAIPEPQIEPPTDHEREEEAEPRSEGITDVAMGEGPR